MPAPAVLSSQLVVDDDSAWPPDVFTVVLAGSCRPSRWLANEFSVALASYVACLQTSYEMQSKSISDTKTVVASATFAACAAERSRVVEMLPLRDADPVLVNVESAARTGMTK